MNNAIYTYRIDKMMKLFESQDDELIQMGIDLSKNFGIFSDLHQRIVEKLNQLEKELVLARIIKAENEFDYLLQIADYNL